MIAKFALPAIVAVAISGMSIAGRTQDLSLQVQIDLAVAALERAMLAEDDGEILDRIDALRELAPELAGGELLYFEATALAGEGKIEEAEQVLNRFLSEVGQQSASYEDALALMLDLEDLLAAREAEQAEMARQAEVARLAELERQKALNEAQRIRDFEASLSANEIRRIKFILQRHAGNLHVPADPMTFTDEDRVKLRTYLADKGMAASSHLSEEIVRHFRSTTFVPVPRQVPTGYDRIVTSGNWTVLEEWNNCVIETPATHFTKDAFFAHPSMSMMAFKNERGATLHFYLTVMNPFSNSRPIEAVVNGHTFPLQLINGRLGPQRSSSNTFSNAVMREIRAGEEVTIKGTHISTGQYVEVSFSAIGFTKAFVLMTEYCSRPDLLWWIE